MANKCAALKFTSGYASNQKKQIAKFDFPLKNVELYQPFCQEKRLASNETLSAV